MSSERFVTTADIRAAAKERETNLLEALNIGWRAGQPQIIRPSIHHADSNPYTTAPWASPVRLVGSAQ
jgi:hypothetical protein